MDIYEFEELGTLEEVEDIEGIGGMGEIKETRAIDMWSGVNRRSNRKIGNIIIRRTRGN